MFAYSRSYPASQSLFLKSKSDGSDKSVPVFSQKTFTMKPMFTQGGNSIFHFEFKEGFLFEDFNLSLSDFKDLTVYKIDFKNNVGTMQSVITGLGISILDFLNAFCYFYQFIDGCIYAVGKDINVYVSSNFPYILDGTDIIGTLTKCNDYFRFFEFYYNGDKVDKSFLIDEIRLNAILVDSFTNLSFRMSYSGYAFKRQVLGL